MKIQKMTAAHTVVRCDDLIEADMDDDLVMMSLKNNSYYSLDPIGKAVWALLCSPVTVGELVTRLTVEFEVGESECLGDVLGLLTELEQEGLIRRVD